ncbi:hypothetical protein CTAYLR_009064 [Chrysophaeum taylorii]|uniref:ribulose-phosphate 3-epimerase n=1 Tax=Chrysophaeum taylorii TaxID=2483200 RepID=A0AAD7UKG6_9STRA|nr:hypothetical protein CTAYLR_009064 [Chrysophaeum taylorii]
MMVGLFVLVVSADLAHSLSATTQHRATRVEALRRASGQGTIVVSPSLAKANLCCLGEEVKAVVDAGAEWLHLSVQDGRMVPKISFGTPLVAAVRKVVPEEIILDVKLSVVEPEHRLRDFVEAGADILSVHPEATLQLPAVINAIDAAGCATGAVLNPGTSVSTIEPILDRLDVIVVMLVNPGWGGPKYLETALDKIKTLRALCAKRGLHPWIEVDGGISSKNAPALLQAGANALVAGGSVFTADDKRAAIGALKGGTAPPRVPA